MIMGGALPMTLALHIVKPHLDQCD